MRSICFEVEMFYLVMHEDDTQFTYISASIWPLISKASNDLTMTSSSSVPGTEHGYHWEQIQKIILTDDSELETICVIFSFRLIVMENLKKNCWK